MASLKAGLIGANKNLGTYIIIAILKKSNFQISHLAIIKTD